MNPLATIASDPSVWQGTLMLYGPMGIFCYWLMKRDERRSAEHKEVCDQIRGLSHRISSLSRTLVLDVLSRESLGPHARKLAEEMLDKPNP